MFCDHFYHFLFTFFPDYDKMVSQQREDSKPVMTHAAVQAIEYSWQQGCLPFCEGVRICPPMCTVYIVFSQYPTGWQFSGCPMEGGIPRYE